MMDVRAGMSRLAKSRYPGRGIVVGQTPDAASMVQVYWIMGRSSSSRNRIFVAEGDAVKTDTVDKSQSVDPLTMYFPVRMAGGGHVVTNGDQTDTICQTLADGGTFEAALQTRKFEPDAPNFTPRISGIVDLHSAHAYQLAILKTVHGDEHFSTRHFFNYETALPGLGHCLTTYVDDGSPLPSFEGEPFLVELFDNLEQTVDVYWSLLNEDNRVSMLVKFIDRESGNSRILIMNKFGS